MAAIILADKRRVEVNQTIGYKIYDVILTDLGLEKISNLTWLVKGRPTHTFKVWENSREIESNFTSKTQINMLYGKLDK